jgi:hypothetical protein
MLRSFSNASTGTEKREPETGGGVKAAAFQTMTLGEDPKVSTTRVKREGMQDGVLKSADRLSMPVEGERVLVPLRDAVAML